MRRSIRQPGNPSRQSVVRVLGYVRVSTNMQKEKGTSIPSQIQDIEDWCRRTFGADGYTLEIERDEGYSGSLPWEPSSTGRGKYRPGLHRVAQRLREGTADYLVVYKVDRLARNLYKQLEFFAEFFGKDSPCKFHTLSENVDLDTLSGQLTANLLSVIADFQRQQICQNVADSMASRRRDGYPTGQIGYGWRRTSRGEGRRTGITPYPEELQWVRRAYELALAGWGVRKIAREFERQGAPAPGTTKGWSDQKVWRMLKQPIHAGLIWDGDEVKRGIHWEHRVVEPDEFAAVQRELELRKRHEVHLVDKELLPLWRVGRCGTCGARLTVVDADGFPAYRCPGSASRGDVLPDEEETEATPNFESASGVSESRPWSGRWCPGWNKAAHHVDRELLRLLEQAVKLPEFLRLAEEEAQAVLQREGREALLARREKAQRILRDLQEQEQKLVRLHLRGSISEEVYDQEFQRLQADQVQTQEELTEMEARLANQEGQAELLARVRETLPDLTRIWGVLSGEERRVLVRELTEYVVLERTAMRQARMRVKVHFLPEQTLILAHSRSRAAGHGTGVDGLTRRELALLCLYAEGKTLKEIAACWGAEMSGLYQKQRSVLRRLGVSTLEEAVSQAWSRIEEERAQLPLTAPTSDHEAPWRGRQQQRIIQVLEGLLEGKDFARIAQEHELAFATVRNMAWKARRIYNVRTVEEAVEQYRQEKERGDVQFARLQDPELRRQLRLMMKKAA
jgi:site-specific DNA recombinase